MNAHKLDITAERFEAEQAGCTAANRVCASRRRQKQVRMTRNGMRAATTWMIFAVGLSSTSPAYSDSSPAMYVTTKSMTVPVHMCVNAAGKAVQQAGLSDITKSDAATGGHTATTRGYIVCVRLSKAGACKGMGRQP